MRELKRDTSPMSMVYLPLRKRIREIVGEGALAMSLSRPMDELTSEGRSQWAPCAGPGERESYLPPGTQPPYGGSCEACSCPTFQSGSGHAGWFLLRHPQACQGSSASSVPWGASVRPA